ncbi:hypothetical protein D3C75_1269350 [compost metagenome]
MGIILAEGTHPHHSVQRAGKLMAVHLAELRQPDGQLPVGMQTVLEDQHMAGTVHRLQRKRILIHLSEIHIVLVMIPMAGMLP